MAIYNIRRTGYGTAADAVIHMIGDLITGGMRMVYPNNSSGPIVPTVLNNIHPETGFMMTTTSINFDGDPYYPVARFILETTTSTDIKAVITAATTTVSFTGTIAPNLDGVTSTLTVTIPPGTGAIAAGMTINDPTGVLAGFSPALIVSGSSTTWILNVSQTIASAAPFTATNKYTSLSDSTVLTAGWRICFDFPLQYLEDYALTTIDPTTKVRTGGLTDKITGSTVFEDFMSVYVGTSVQLRNDGQISILPDIYTIGNAVKVNYVQPDGLIGASYRKPGINSVATKTVALAPPVAIMKGYVSSLTNKILTTTKRLGGSITNSMNLTGSETSSTGKNLRLLPYTYINEDPLTSSSQQVNGTGLGDAGTYYISTPAGFTQYAQNEAFVPQSSGEAIRMIGVSTDIDGADVGFINRINLDRLSGLAIPLSYEITTTKKGVFIGVWDVLSEQNGKRFNWLLVQRSVDRISGAIRGRTKTTETGTAATFLDATVNSVCPVYCVNSVNNLYYQFVVREQDNGGPSIPRSASVNSEDNTAIINPFDQQSITDDGQYVITFLNKLNTSRYRYPDELDMVGTVSSDVIGFGSSVRISAYGEETAVTPLQRVYRSLPSNNPYGTGMRLMILNTWETIDNGVGVQGTPNVDGPVTETPT